MTPEIELIITKMTIEEKAALCTGASAWTTTSVRVKILFILKEEERQTVLF